MSSKRRGRRKKRSELKEVLLLLLLRMESPIGRYRLKELLDLSDHEGLVRLMLSDLAEKGYVEADKAGCSLTESGQKLLDSILSRAGIGDVKPLALSELKLGPACVAVHVRDRAAEFRDGIEQRDAAVRAGASGATVLLFRGNAFAIPSVYPNLSAKYPDLAKRILGSFKLSDGDALIVGFAGVASKALEGALAAVMRA
jgi:hypothetical protein